MLLFGPNPISSMHYKDSEITHFCSPGREERVAGAWAAAGAGGAGCAPQAAAASKGNHSRETSPETKNHIQFPDYCFLPRVIYFGNRTFNK